jgi:protoporphyrinogen oxidase
MHGNEVISTDRTKEPQHIRKSILMNDSRSDILVLGGGLTGLSAGYLLARSGCAPLVFENDAVVGGISKTIHQNGYRFDLGGHRFFTKNKEVEQLILDLMTDELVPVARKSKIFMRERYFDYPLKPLNAVFGFGLATSVRILADYLKEKVSSSRKGAEPRSLEEWVVGNFGSTMYEIYFKIYSEKVWGIPCDRISASWVDQRISGLSLAKVLKNAVFRLNGKALPTLVDSFLYPRLGIGRISDRLREEIEAAGGRVATGTRVERLHHDGARITGIEVRNSGQAHLVTGPEVISSIPVTHLVKMLSPAPPAEVLEAASNLRFRDLVVVALMINKPRVTDQTWIYIPERHIPFGRIHEPTNWSEQMAPPARSLLVMEYFSTRGDHYWTMKDEDLARLTVRHLEQLGYIAKDEVVDSAVVRVPKAYPLFEVGHERFCEVIERYLERFENLFVGGRAGKFQYLNMDHAIESGMNAARDLLRRRAHREDDQPPAVDRREDAHVTSGVAAAPLRSR